MSDTCQPNHDVFNTILTIGLIGGLFTSYMPQHFRIINKGSSEGFSPWFLLLGATSSAAGMLNMWTMQWGVVKCCRYLSTGGCLESLGGVIQVTIQWFLFNMILVLYLLYYPPHLKYATDDISPPPEIVSQTHSTTPLHVKTHIKSDHWRLSTTLSWVVLIHVALCTFITFFLLLTTKPDPIFNPDVPWQNKQVTIWATFLGVTSAVLAAVQYYPQLVHTYRLKLVGALSIPMMLIQSPGAALMVISIAMRPGTDWTSWIMFAVSGIMQAILLVMCLVWKARQRRLGIDDFGQPVAQPEFVGGYTDNDGRTPEVEEPIVSRRVNDLRGAVEDAVEGGLGEREARVRGGADGAETVSRVVDARSGEVVVEERTPLLGNKPTNGDDKKSGSGVWRWFGW